jgi:hypothetical protein
VAIDPNKFGAAFQSVGGWLALVVHVGNSIMDRPVEIIDIGEGLMREEMAFEIAPGSLDVIEFRSIFRQPFDGQPVPRGERSLQGFAEPPRVCRRLIRLRTLPRLAVRA